MTKSFETVLRLQQKQASVVWHVCKHSSLPIQLPVLVWVGPPTWSCMRQADNFDEEAPQNVVKPQCLDLSSSLQICPIHWCDLGLVQTQVVQRKKLEISAGAMRLCAFLPSKPWRALVRGNVNRAGSLRRYGREQLHAATTSAGSSRITTGYPSNVALEMLPLHFLCSKIAP